MAINAGGVYSELILDTSKYNAGLVAAERQMQNFSSKMQGMGQKMEQLGGTLTKKVTLPVTGLVAAAGGIVTAFGWKRLVGLDSAQAQLKGLGYEVKDVERISGIVKDSIQGTTTTMAEGVSVAAGALAAGVKEGAELERYIKLVGDAAVGSNRAVGDMAMIFHRVQGAGKLMTQELNMIEQGMPGFAQAMATSLGVTQAEFRKMVTEGKISSEQFLDVMEDFAGEMSDAYANSWEGMVSNTKANIGIIGEHLLGGVFEQSKESIAEFLELLRSDDVRQWAAETGQKIGEAFSAAIEGIKRAIEWWNELSEGTKKFIMILAGFAVAIGPVLMALGMLAKAIVAISAAIPILGAVFAALTGPIGVIVAGIIGLIAVGKLLNENWDEIKAEAIRIWTSIKDFFAGIWEDLKTGWTEGMSSMKKTFSDFGKQISEGWTKMWNGVKDFFEKWGKNILLLAIGPAGWAVLLAKQLGVNWDSIKNTATNIWDAIKNSLNNTWNSINSTANSVWNRIKEAIINPIRSAQSTLNSIITSIKNAFANMRITIPKPKLPHINVSSRSISVGGASVSIPKFDISWYAKGTDFAKGGWAVVGEEGPELLNIPRGSKVVPNNKLGGVGGGDIIIQQMNVRNDNDIRLIARELYNLQQQGARGRGLATT